MLVCASLGRDRCTRAHADTSPPSSPHPPPQWPVNGDLQYWLRSPSEIPRFTGVRGLRFLRPLRGSQWYNRSPQWVGIRILPSLAVRTEVTVKVHRQILASMSVSHSVGTCCWDYQIHGDCPGDFTQYTHAVCSE